MFKHLRKEFLIVNMSLIFTLLVVASLTFYFVSRIQMEQSISHSMSIYMSEPIEKVKNDEENPRLFISTIDTNAYKYVSSLVNANYFKYFNTIYASDSFTTSQINNILSRVIDDRDYASTIKVEDRYYKYVKQNIEDEKIKILVLDITNKLAHLNSIAYTLSEIAAISLILIYFVSKFITNRSIKPIEAMFNRQMEFISNISHELKTPLTIAITNLAVIESHKDELVKEQEKWIGFIQFQLDRLSNLIEEMLLLERLDSFEPQPNMEYFDLSSLINWYIKSMKALSNGKNISINKDIQKNIHIYADKELIIRLISILADNAIKYTPDNGIITISLSESREKISMSVENTGEGIKPEHIDRIFDRFYRIDKSRSSRNGGGSGLGLAIAKSIVENIYGGNISVESTVGEKTTFYVTLPKA